MIDPNKTPFENALEQGKKLSELFIPEKGNDEHEIEDDEESE